jgi:hypothetical protein
VGGEDLFDQGRAGSGKADDKYRPLAGYRACRQRPQKISIEAGRSFCEQRIILRMAERTLQAYQSGAFRIRFERPIVVTDIVERFAKGVEQSAASQIVFASCLWNGGKKERQVGVVRGKALQRGQGEPAIGGDGIQTDSGAQALESFGGLSELS